MSSAAADVDTMPAPLTPAAAEALLKEIDYVLFDIDGVIWSGDHVFYKVPETLLWLAVTMGKKVRFLTNNATRTRAATKDEFKAKGFSFVTNEMIYSSAYVAALELKARWAQRRDEETAAALSSVPNPFVAACEGGLVANTTGADAADCVEAALYARQSSMERFDSDRFPHNVFVIGEKGLHDELRDVALAPDATTVGLELVIDPASPHALLRTPMYPSVERALREPLIPVGVRVMGGAVGGAAASVSAVVSGGSPHAAVCPSSPSAAAASAGSAGATPGASISVSCVPCAASGLERMESVESLNCGAVVVGLDRHFNMLKLSVASMILERSARGAAANSSSVVRCDFIATNEDPSITIGEGGYHFPGAGAVVAAVSTAVGRAPDFVCGKPHQLMAKVLLANEGITDPARCLMVGDRLTTDIAFGRGMGARTLMVLTGAETLKDVERSPAAIRPEFVAQSAADLRYEATD